MTTMNRVAGESVGVWVPTAADVAEVRVGTLVPDPYGRWSPVVEVTHLGTDIVGQLFVCYYTPTGTGSGRISNSIKAGELVRHLGLRMTSAELDRLEARIRAEQVA